MATSDPQYHTLYDMELPDKVDDIHAVNNFKKPCFLQILLPIGGNTSTDLGRVLWMVCMGQHLLNPLLSDHQCQHTKSL